MAARSSDRKWFVIDAQERRKSRNRNRRLVVELIERRELLAVSILAGSPPNVVEFLSDDADDVFLLGINAEGNLTHSPITGIADDNFSPNFGETLQLNPASAYSFMFQGAGNASLNKGSTVILNYNGTIAPFPANGMAISGASNQGNLVVQQLLAGVAAYEPNSPTPLTFSSPSVSAPTFSNLSSVDLSNQVFATISLTCGAGTATLLDDATPGDNISQAMFANAPLLKFAGPLTELQINNGSVVEIDALDANFSAGVTTNLVNTGGIATLNATTGNGIYAINGGLGNDTVLVQSFMTGVTVNAGGGDDAIRVQGTGVNTGNLVVRGESGNDTLTLDYVSGDPVPSTSNGTILFAGGTGSGNLLTVVNRTDQLTVLEMTAIATPSSPEPNARYTQIHMNGSQGDDLVTLASDMTTGSLVTADLANLNSNTVNLGISDPAGRFVALRNDGAGISLGTFDGTLSDPFGTGAGLRFSNPAPGVTINGGVGNDTVLVQSFMTSVTVNAGDGDDAIRVQGTGVNTGNLVVRGESGNDTLTLDYVSGDPVPSTANGTILFAGGTGSGNLLTVVNRADQLTVLEMTAIATPSSSEPNARYTQIHMNGSQGDDLVTLASDMTTGSLVTADLANLNSNTVNLGISDPAGRVIGVDTVSSAQFVNRGTFDGINGDPATDNPGDPFSGFTSVLLFQEPAQNLLVTGGDGNDTISNRLPLSFGVETKIDAGKADDMVSLVPAAPIANLTDSLKTVKIILGEGNDTARIDITALGASPSPGRYSVYGGKDESVMVVMGETNRLRIDSNNRDVVARATLDNANKPLPQQGTVTLPKTSAINDFDRVINAAAINDDYARAFTVTNSYDFNGADGYLFGSLREALTNAQKTRFGSTNPIIAFDTAGAFATPASIDLKVNLPVIDSAITLQGPGKNAGGVYLVTLDGDTNAVPFGLQVNTADAFSILGLQIQNMTQTGISVTSNNGGSISGNLIQRNGTGVYATASSQLVVQNNDILYNSGAGVSAMNSSGIIVGMLNSPTTSGNRITYNGDGVAFSTVADSEIVGNEIAINSGNGISLLAGSQNIQISQNTIAYNINSGVSAGNTSQIFLGKLSSPTLPGNTISNNGGDGVAFSTVTGSEIVGNQISLNVSNGISLLVGSQNIQISQNTIDHNTKSGVSADGNSSGIYIGKLSSPTFPENTITNNGGDGVAFSTVTDSEIGRNEITLNSGNGISLLAGSQNVQVSGNKIDHNTKSGVSVANSSGIFVGKLSSQAFPGNTITKNGSDGVVFSAVTDSGIGGNEITLNSGKGILLLAGSQNVQVTGNKIDQNTSTGVSAGNSSRIFVGMLSTPTYSGNTITYNGGDGVAFSTVSDSGIDGNYISKNAVNGVAVSTNSINNRIANNSVDGNQVNGILVVSASITNILGNAVTNNLADGIALSGGNNARVEYNRVGLPHLAASMTPPTGFGNGGRGIVLENETGSDVVARNTVVSSGLANLSTAVFPTSAWTPATDHEGILVMGGTGTTVSFNTVGVVLQANGTLFYRDMRFMNLWDGIALRNTQQVTVSGNTVAANGRVGICVEQSQNNLISKNYVGTPAAEFANLAGLAVPVPVLGQIGNPYLTTRPTAYGNNGDGIFLGDSSGNTIIANVVAGNFVLNSRVKSRVAGQKSDPDASIDGLAAYPANAPSQYYYLANGIHISGPLSKNNKVGNVQGGQLVEQNILGGNLAKNSTKKIAVWNQGYPILVDTGAKPENVIQKQFSRVKKQNVYNNIVINTYDPLVNQLLMPLGDFKYTPSPVPTPVATTHVAARAIVRGPAALSATIPTRTRARGIRRK